MDSFSMPFCSLDPPKTSPPPPFSLSCVPVSDSGIGEARELIDPGVEKSNEMTSLPADT